MRPEASDRTIAWVCGNAESLPVEDSSQDAYTIAFGIRNTTHLDKALSEAYRVLKPGGRFLCLEFSRVAAPGLDDLYDLYSFAVLPTARRAGGGRRRGLSLSRRKHPPLPAAGGLREDDREGGLLSGEIPQSLRRHRRHAFGLESVMFRTLKDIAVLIRMARALAAYDALLPREYAARVPVSLRVAARLFGSGRRKHAHLAPGKRLASALEQLGPSAIKVGQFLATRPDILGADVARGLETLQDRLPPFPEIEARRIVEAELGRPIERLFSEFRSACRRRFDRTGASGGDRR